MELPASHPPFRFASSSSATPDSRQHSFDETPYFGTVSQDVSNFPASRVTKSSVEPWLMTIATASPASSRLSMSPSQGIATPPSAGCCSPPYPGQLQLPPYQLSEQPHSVRPRSTSHSDWVSYGEDWERTYIEGDLWSAQPDVAQPWDLTSYTSYPSPHAAPDDAQTSSGALQPYPYPMQAELSAPGILQLKEFVSDLGERIGTVSLDDKRTQDEDEGSSDGKSDWDGESSNSSQSGGPSSRSRSGAQSPRPHNTKFSVPISVIQQQESRGYLCEVPGCDSSFLRPEHLRRHVKSKHCETRPYICKISGCSTPFSRGDNLRDHYWTHLDRGGRKGKNRKFAFAELKELLGPKEKKLIRRLRQKQRQHEEKEKLKKQHTPRPAYVERLRL